MKRSTLCNIEVIKENKKEGITLVEYTPYGAIQDGNPDKRLYATIWNYNGEKTWDNGALVSVTLDSALDDFYHMSNSTARKVDLKLNTLEMDTPKKVCGECVVTFPKGKKEDVKFCYNLSKNEIDLEESYGESEDDSIKSLLIKELENLNYDALALKSYNFGQLIEDLKSALTNHFKDDPDMMEYAGIETKPTRDGVKITAYAEVYYEELEQICEELDKVLKTYDLDAYFEPETSGRAVCYIYFN